MSIMNILIKNIIAAMEHAIVSYNYKSRNEMKETQQSCSQPKADPGP